MQLTLRRELLKGDSTAKSGDNIAEIERGSAGFQLLAVADVAATRSRGPSICTAGSGCWRRAALMCRFAEPFLIALNWL